MITTRVSGVTDFAALGERWRDLEQRADGSFFQTWTWAGCLAAERFPDPVLVEATEAGRTVALALFNRVRARLGQPDLLHLGETGDTALDSPYIEHNGVLAETGREDALTEACLGAVLHSIPGSATASHVIILSGIGERGLQAAKRVAGAVCIAKEAASPFVDLSALRRSGTAYLAARSSNTRQQIRRSDRSYAALGALTVRRAQTPAAAHAMLDAMAALHQTGWIARGQPGSFATPFFGRFHHALIDIGFPRNELVLMATYTAEALIGVLYNFSFRGRTYAYQSGFACAAARTLGKPGLTCHHAAIQQALVEGTEIYDFLAGDARYKRSLADGSDWQYWAEAGPAWSLRLLSRRLRKILRP